MALIVETDSFGPTGNMRRKEAVHLRYRPMRSARKWRYPAFWWRLYPRNHCDWYRRILRRDVRPKKGKIAS